MKYWIRRMRRHRVLSILTLLTYIVLLFLLFDVTGELNRASQYGRDYSAFQAKEEASIKIEPIDEDIWEWLPRLNPGEGVSVLLQPFYTYFGESEIQPLLYVPVFIGEELPFYLLSGTLPEHGMAIAAGRMYTDLIQKKNGKEWLTLENIDYEVTGKIGNPGSDYQDSCLVVSYDSLTDAQKKRMMETGSLSLKVRSNTVSLQPVLQSLYEQIMKFDSQTAVSVSAVAFRNVEGEADLSELLYQAGLYLMCLVLLVLLSAYQIRNRMQELAVRKVLGQGTGEIVRMLLMENSAGILVTFVFYFAVHSGFCFWQKQSVLPGSAKDFAQNLLIGFCCLILVLVSSTAIPAWIVHRLHPAEILSSGEGAGV